MVMGVTTRQKEKEAGITEKIHQKKQMIDYRVVSIFPDSLPQDEYVFLGAFNWTYRNAKVKYVDAGTAIRTTAGRVSPTEYARIYLMLKYGGRAKVTAQQMLTVTRTRTPPLFSLPGHYPNMVYADLTAAYWSILKLVAWDTDYNPGRWWSIGDSMTDFPRPNHKMARNMLVTSATMGELNVSEYGTLKNVAFNNPLLNSPLWAAVQDTLHLVANYAINNGAKYVHTDGYIIPESLYPVMADWCDVLGLTLSVKHQGDAAIYGAGRYEIGDSRRLTGKEKSGGTIANVYPVDADWMMPRLKAFAKSRQAEDKF